MQTVMLAHYDLAGGFTDPELWQVQPGDWFWSEDDRRTGGILHKITAVDPTTQTITVLSRNPEPTLIVKDWSPGFKIVRAPRPLTGEPLKHLPKDVAIDLGTPALLRSQIQPSTTPQRGQNLDVLFNGGGTIVAGANQVAGKVVLWVRDTHLDGYQGQQVLVVVWTRTARVGTYPADPGPNNDYLTYPPGKSPYTFLTRAQDGGL
jgi:hypothetical protein